MTAFTQMHYAFIYAFIYLFHQGVMHCCYKRHHGRMNIIKLYTYVRAAVYAHSVVLADIYAKSHEDQFNIALLVLYREGFDNEVDRKFVQLKSERYLSDEKTWLKGRERNEAWRFEGAR